MGVSDQPVDAVLALDVGMTAVKAAVIRRDGQFLALVRRFWPERSRPFALSQDVDVVWPTVADAARAAVRSVPAVHIAAVVPTAAAALGLCLDAGGNPFVLAEPPAPRGRRRYAPASGYGRTLVQVVARARRHDPGALARAARVGALHTYLVWRLCGRWASDAATGPGGPRWPAALLRMARLDPQALPEILPQEAAAGTLGEEAARSLALPGRPPVVVGGHDGASASFGAGAVQDGDCLLNLSTNFVPRVVTGAPVPGLFGYPIRPGAWAWVDGLAGAGRQLDVAAEILAPLIGGREILAAAALAAVRRRAVAETLPYLSPARAATQPARVRARLGRTLPPDVLYAALALGVAEALATRVGEAEGKGVHARRFVATGGFTRQAVVVEAIALALGQRPFLAHPEAGALGAAALAAVAAGWAATPEDALRAWARGREPS